MKVTIEGLLNQGTSFKTDLCRLKSYLISSSLRVVFIVPTTDLVSTWCADTKVTPTTLHPSFYLRTNDTTS